VKSALTCVEEENSGEEFTDKVHHPGNKTAAHHHHHGDAGAVPPQEAAVQPLLPSPASRPASGSLSDVTGGNSIMEASPSPKAGSRGKCSPKIRTRKAALCLICGYRGPQRILLSNEADSYVPPSYTVPVKKFQRHSSKEFLCLFS
jgi:hypothetical protein